MNIKERRLARILVTPDIVLHWGLGGFRCVRNPIPEDAQVVGVYVDDTRQAISITIWSKSFDEVPFGMVVPLHDAPVFEAMESECVASK